MKAIAKKIYKSVFDKSPVVYYQKFFLHPFGNFIGKYFGKAILSTASPSTLERSRAKIFIGTNNLIEYIIIGQLNKKFIHLSEKERENINRSGFWGSVAGKNWHKTRENYYNDLEVFHSHYLKPRYFLIETLQKTVNEEKISTIIEVGTGSAKFISYLSETVFPEMKFIGLDINNSIIEENKLKYASNPNLEFYFAELSEFLENNPKENCCILGTGTLEFFTTSEFDRLFEILNRKFNKISIALCEPVERGFDNSNDSTYRGTATFYSHNYPKMFSNQGFQINYLNMPFTEKNPGNLITLIATKQHGV